MATPNTMKDVPLTTVLDALNGTKTVTDAAKRLDTTRQTLNHYIKANRIKKECKYVAPPKILELTTTASQDKE